MCFNHSFERQTMCLENGALTVQSHGAQWSALHPVSVLMLLHTQWHTAKLLCPAGHFAVWPSWHRQDPAG